MATVSGDEVQAENGAAALKQSTLKLVQTVKKITTRLECELILEEEVLRWKWEVPQVTPPATKGKDETPKENKTEAITTEESVRINWVVKAQVETAQPSEKPEAENGETTSDLIIHYIKRQELPEFRFSLAQAKFSAPSNICTEWETFLNEHVAKKAPQRPKSLLVILNPASGHKKAEKLYKEKAAPVFEVFGINVELVVSKKAKESSEILENHDLSKFDGVVSVGGDGTHTEVCSALLERTMKAAGVEDVSPSTELQQPSIRHGMIPAGAGNGQQYFGSYSRDVVTSAVVIAMGDSRLRDLVTIHCGEKLLAYGGLLVAYGLLSQAMELMENNRWAGPARYLGMAFITFVKRKAVDVQLDYLPGDEESFEDFQVLCEAKPPKSSPATAASGDQKGTAAPKTEDGEQKETTPADGATDEAKDAAQAEGTDAEQKGTSEAEEAKDGEKGSSPAADEGAVNGEAPEKEPEKVETEEKKEAENEEGPKDGSDAAAVTKETEDGAVASAEVVEEVEDPLPEGWKRVKGRFLGVDCFMGRLDKIDINRLYKYENDLTPGVLGLQITQPCGRMEHVKFIRRLQKGDFPKANFVKMLGVKEFRLKAIGDWQNSAKANAVDWDGDMLYTPEPHFEVKSHAQILPTFARMDGPELKDICLKAEEELKKAALERSQSGARASSKKSKEKAAQNGGKKDEAEQKPTENSENKASEADGKPAEAENEGDEKTTEETKTETETEKKETDENLPKAEVEIKVTEAPENEAQ